MTMTRTGSPDEDYGCCGQLVQGINDTIYAYGGDNQVNGFNSDYDPLEEALRTPNTPPIPTTTLRTRRTFKSESEYIPNLDSEGESEDYDFESSSEYGF